MKIFCLLLGFLWAPLLLGRDTLDFYFVDVEQGSSMLIVSPSGESMLIDTGSRGRDGSNVRRILSVASKAGVKQIDYLLITHYHDDHYGGVRELATKIPILNFVDHGPSVETGKDDAWRKHWEIGTNDRQFAEYCRVRDKANHIVAKPGDKIPIKGIDVTVLTSAGEKISKPLEGAGAPNPSCAITPLRTEDETEDGQSVGVLIQFGQFRFVSLGDVTWNKARRVFCPNNLVGTTDVYVTTHHAMSIDKEDAGPIRWGRSSCSEAELNALQPRVAILNYGERYHRLGGPRGWHVVRDSPRLEDFWQLHYQVEGGNENNAPERLIANMSAKDCQGYWIQLSAKSDASFTVTNTRNGYAKRYEPTQREKPGNLVADEQHPQWLRYSDGRPFFLCGPGDPEGFLYRGSRNPDGTRNGDQSALINKLKGTGANSIYLMAVRSNGGDGDPTQNPFVDHDPAKGLSAAILDQWERWFTEMDNNGIVIFFFFYDDNASIWSTGDAVGSEERKFLHALVNRFKRHRHLIWCIAEEYQEKLTPKRVSNIAAEIRSADEFKHPIAVHKLNGLDFSEFASDPNIDEFAIQFNVPTAAELHQGVVRAWRGAAGRYNLNMSEAAEWGSGVTSRKKMWAAAMGGAYVMVLGMDIATTAPSDLRDCGRLVRFMESTNFYEMAPHDELAHGGAEYVLAKPGDSYIAYASDAAVPIGLKGMMPGIYDFKWYDPATGVTVEQTNMRVAGGDQTWEKPSRVGTEVALFLRRNTQ